MGCHIARNRKARELKLDQHIYVETVVGKYDIKKESGVPAAYGVPTIS